MQFLMDLLGGSVGTIVGAALALGIVLVLIVLGLWLVKLTLRTGGAVGRGRNARLGVVDNVQIDEKRRLLIVRRDNVEHLIMTGGPQDLVIETGIPVERASAIQTPRRPESKDAAPTPPARPAGEVPPVRTAAADRFKELARANAAQPKRSVSLRHTGLLRPVSTMEPAIIPMPPIAGDNSGRPRADSATTAQGIDNGRTGRGATELGAQRNFGDQGSAERR